ASAMNYGVNCQRNSAPGVFGPPTASGRLDAPGTDIGPRRWRLRLRKPCLRSFELSNRGALALCQSRPVQGLLCRIGAFLEHLPLRSGVYVIELDIPRWS